MKLGQKVILTSNDYKLTPEGSIGHVNQVLQDGKLTRVNFLNLSNEGSSNTSFLVFTDYLRPIDCKIPTKEDLNINKNDIVICTGKRMVKVKVVFKEKFRGIDSKGDKVESSYFSVLSKIDKKKFMRKFRVKKDDPPKKEVKNSEKDIQLEYWSLINPDYFRNDIRDFKKDVEKKDSPKEVLYVIKNIKTGNTFKIKLSDIKTTGLILAIYNNYKQLNVPTQSKTKRYDMFNRTFNSEVQGTVHTKSNFFYDMMIEKNMDLVRETKKPKTSHNHIGLEIECLTKPTREELDKEIIKHKLHRNIKLVNDGSLRSNNGKHPIELQVIFKQDEMEEILKRVCKLLHEVDAEINESCGLHVHLDMRNRNAELSYERLVRSQLVLFNTQPKKRRTNQYCVPNKYLTYKQQRANDNTKYRAINVGTIDEHTTLEVRLHEGTIDYDQIFNWVTMLIDIINTPNEELVRDVNQFIDIIKPTNPSYVMEKVQQYA